MKPFYTDEWLTLYGGDCCEVLAGLPGDSVDCVVTSPPYWGLRDYGQDGQLGLERTPEEYVANMVAVFREVRRVLKPSGTCWLNLGDSYASDTKGTGGPPSPTLGIEAGTGRSRMSDANRERAQRRNRYSSVKIDHGLKPKDLVGIPWRVAFALQADGWYLRSDIIWSKPNPMPESVTDRPTKSHEYLFLLTKSARYFFDNEAVREGVKPGTRTDVRVMPRQGGSTFDEDGSPSMVERNYDTIKGANIRSVWTIATRPYPGAHFAVFPPELPERCIKAGSSEKGVCPECGAPWERVVERTQGEQTNGPKLARLAESGMSTNGTGKSTLGIGGGAHGGAWSERGTKRDTAGWRPTCRHYDGDYQADYPPLDPVPAVILDPFGGSGTVGMVANRLSRRAILIDLNPEYLKQQMKRNAQVPLGLSEGDAA